MTSKKRRALTVGRGRYEGANQADYLEYLKQRLSKTLD
jgi:hypothetical protein